MSHIVTRGLTALALGGFATLTLTGTAHAADAPNCGQPNEPSCTASTGTGSTGSDTGSAGGAVNVDADGFQPNSPVTITVCGEDVAGTFTTDANGTFSGSVPIPDDAEAGSCTITVSGTGMNGAGRVVTSEITITGASTGGSSTGSGGDLPFTGFELGAASVLGAGLLGAGTIAVIAGRKRKDGLNAA